MQFQFAVGKQKTWMLMNLIHRFLNRMIDWQGLLRDYRIHEKYEWIILTRSDYVYLCTIADFKLDNGTIYLPIGEQVLLIKQFGVNLICSTASCSGGLISKSSLPSYIHGHTLQYGGVTDRFAIFPSALSEVVLNATRDLASWFIRWLVACWLDAH